MELGTRTSHDLVQSDKVEGTAVFGPDGERLGSVDHFMVDKVSGQVEYAVLAFGGLFGLGHKHYPLPWKTLSYDTEKGGYTVNVTKEQLEGAPSYESGDAPDYDKAYGDRVYSYYGLSYVY
ncbi:PRC-barrel domain-containing protein [Sphingomonas sp.]|uniref:PRC-barrel domain-containing protein n=1 Tax=Sphingomonas sp. TaxID=28214 RepID=UPI001B2BBE78|nr:PRC-barrel domain-containing protein [Sphingomonas sp.]MBO9713795.1 PRC-barrel domain-containing protein [Sphingomonas sp.]